MECSRCEVSYDVDKWGFCYELSSFVVRTIPMKCKCGEDIPSFWTSMLKEGHEKTRICPGYASKHDLCAFAFVDPSDGKELTKDGIVQRHLWIEKDVVLRICDNCIDKMLEYKELKELKTCYSEFAESMSGIDDYSY